MYGGGCICMTHPKGGPDALCRILLALRGAEAFEQPERDFFRGQLGE
jgi:hypothetical protein